MSLKKPRFITAFTLVEIMVVVGIILVLTVVLWLLLGPTVKARALDSRITSDLRQIASAINIYQQDNNEKLPLWMGSLPKSVPQGMDGYENKGALAPGFQGPRIYMICCSQADLDDMDRLHCINKWDPTRSPIAEAPFRQRLSGGIMRLAEYNVADWTVKYYHESPEVLNLKVFLDGHVKWVSSIEEWQNELALRRIFIR